MRLTRLAPLFAATLFACHAQAADLLQVYKEALANDAVFASARASLTAGAERAPQGLAGLLPNLGVSGSYVRNNSSIDVPSVPLNRSSGATLNTYTVSLAQPLVRWANWETYQQGKLLTAVSEAQFSQAQQDLIVRVAQA
jgi:outer membrane protein